MFVYTRALFSSSLILYQRYRTLKERMVANILATRNVAYAGSNFLFSPVNNHCNTIAFEPFLNRMKILEI